MYWFLSILGYFWFILGAAAFIFTGFIKRHYSIFIIGNHPKSMGALAILVGALLISSMVSCKYYAAVLMLGIIQVIKGIYLIFPPKKYVEGLINWWLNASLFIYRMWAIITLAMGWILLKARL